MNAQGECGGRNDGAERRQRDRSHEGGFTIIELVIVVVIAGVLVAIAVPNLADFIKNNARAAALNTMVATITYGRSQAVTSRQDAVFCQSSNGATCTNGADFHDGYLLFLDQNRDGTFDVADGDRLLRAGVPEVSDDVTLVGRTGAADVTSITFTSSGAASGVAADTHIRYCDIRGNVFARAVEVTPSGQTRLSEDSSGSGVHNVGRSDLSCTTGDP